MVASAHPQDFLVWSFDGSHEAAYGMPIAHAVHGHLAKLVGFSFVVGFLFAIAIYAKGLALAERIKNTFKPIHTLLEHKFYFDELYDTFLVGGVLVIKSIAYVFDKFIVDGVVNLSGILTKWLALLSGRVIDAKGVDGLVNGIGYGALELGGAVRTPQDGRIRNYILYVAGGAMAVVLVIVFVPWSW
jgi:NADH-quinone oxidoreductase subunit L